MPSSDCNNIYAEKINILVGLNIVKGERVFGNQGKLKNECFKHCFDEYGGPY